MARPKFKIDNKIDKRNFLKYLENNRVNVLFDLSQSTGDDHAFSLKKKEEFINYWDNLTSAAYILDVSQKTYFEDLSILLYMLPDPLVAKIKISLRARRKTSDAKGKTQMTIDSLVHSDLTKFAAKNDLTLSDAICSLIELKEKYGDA